MESGNLMNAQLEFPVDGMKRYMYEQLWKLIAGPMCDLPKCGEYVYYFPQGHVEFIEKYAREEVNLIHPNLGLPSKIRCRVIDIQLKAEKQTDEIYAEITLMPDTTTVDEISTQNVNHNGPMIHSVTKILSVSDANGHGGFTVPKRQASQCLPPLEMSHPTQELITTDIHDNEWRFKHILRSSPQRHVLTVGWSKFVTEKEVVAGDLFVLLGGENGELRVGIRRARHRERNLTSTSGISIESMIHGVVATAKQAFDKNCMFTVVYKPSIRGKQFVVSYNKFMDAINNKFNIGSKFSMRFEADDFSEISYSGIITGVSNFSSIWKDSEWRSLQVKWDVPDAPFLRPTTVSPWEIQHLEEPSSIMIKNKRSRQIEIGSNSSHRTPLTLTHGQEIGQPSLNCPTSSHVAELGNRDVMEEDVVTPPSYLMSNSVQTPPKLDVNSITLLRVSIPIPSQIKDPKQVVNSSEISKFSQEKKIGHVNKLTSEEFSSSKRSIKVLKQGETVERSLDLSVLNGSYDQLIGELEKLFDLKGQLQNHNQWNIVFEDNEGDMMLVGDHPWLEFCNIVKKIIIKCSKNKRSKSDNNLSN